MRSMTITYDAAPDFALVRTFGYGECCGGRERARCARRRPRGCTTLPCGGKVSIANGVLIAAWRASDDHRQSTVQTALQRCCEGFHDVYQNDARRIKVFHAASLLNGVYRWEKRRLGAILQK